MAENIVFRPADAAAPKDYRAVLADRRARGQATRWKPIAIGLVAETPAR